MKKILSLVLAAAMLTTTAFAATVPVGGNGASDLTDANPGDTLRILGSEFASGKNALLNDDWHFSSEYLTISSKSFEKGSNLVKEVKFNDDKLSIDIVLNTDYAKTAPNGENLVIKKLAVKGRTNYDASGTTGTGVPIYENAPGDIKKGAEYEYKGAKALTIGYVKVTHNLDNAPSYLNGVLVTFATNGGVSYETVSLDNAADVYIEGRVYGGDKVYVEVNNDVDKEILKASSDEADIRFYNVVTNGFPTANTIQLSAEEDEFVYKIVDGKLVASGLKWSADDYAWTGKIRSNVSYVVSDMELKNVAAEGDKPATTNPDTGANDVVGIAAALAVVSLVAAGAVSLKK